MNSTKNFQETGNKIPVSEDELINYIYSQLAIFDKTKQGTNPYTTQIIYKTKAGKTIMIPKDIQQRAISLWKMKNKVHENFQQEIQTEATAEAAKAEIINNATYDNYELLKFTLLILVIIITLYLFFNADNAKSAFSTQNIRYYLTKN